MPLAVCQSHRILEQSLAAFFGPLPEAEDQSSDIGICVVNKTHRRVYTGSRSLLW